MNVMQDFLLEIWKCDFLTVCNIMEYSHGGISPRVDNRPARSWNLSRHDDCCRKAVLLIRFFQVYLTRQFVLAVIVQWIFSQIIRVKWNSFNHAMRLTGWTIKIVGKLTFTKSLEDFFSFFNVEINQINDDIRLHFFKLADKLWILFTILQNTIDLVPCMNVLIRRRQCSGDGYRFVSIVHEHGD